MSSSIKNKESTVLIEIIGLKDDNQKAQSVVNDPLSVKIQQLFDYAFAEKIDLFEDSFNKKTSMTSENTMKKDSTKKDLIEPVVLEFEIENDLTEGNIALESMNDTHQEIDFKSKTKSSELPDLIEDFELEQNIKSSHVPVETNSSELGKEDEIFFAESEKQIENTLKDIISPAKEDSTSEFTIDTSMINSETEEVTNTEFSYGKFKSEEKIETKDSSDPFEDDYLINLAVNSEKNDKGLNTLNSHPHNYIAEVKEEVIPVRSTPQPLQNTSEMLDYQSTIRALREERENYHLEIKKLKNILAEYEQDNLTLKAYLDESRIEVSILRKRLGNEIEDVKYKLGVSEEKRLMLEEKCKSLEKLKEKLEQKVRIDIGQVRNREKELESKLELMTMDIDTQVHSREQKILELRRKVDSLEFNIENASIREQKATSDKRKLEEKLMKILKTLRTSIENLEEEIEDGSHKLKLAESVNE